MEINPKNILVVQIGKLGDMVLTSPLFYELKNIFPQAKLKVLASPVNKEFVSGLKAVDEVIVYQKNVLKDLFLASRLKKENFDLWIDVKDGYSRTASSLLKLAKPKLALGYNVPNPKNEKVFDVDLKEFTKGKHAVDLSLATVYYFGKEPVNPKPVLTDFIQKETNGKSDLLINLSAGDPSRYLDIRKWNALVGNVLDKNPSIRIHLIGIEKDAQLLLDIDKTFKTEHITYKYNYDLKELINELNSSKLIISADTSIVHFSSGLNKPIIGLYPKVDWNYERFKPLSDINETIISNSEKGIEDINAEDIYEKFVKISERI
ncbi:MAG: glycosyltransferase family 9 protein [Bacteroidetes bacterium]|nr:glycosyltransferase family 9 protein [Bacteroidota bacterium]